MATIEERLKDASPRLIILAACAFARTVEHLLTDQRSRDAIETAERYADGQATHEELSTVEVPLEWKTEWNTQAATIPEEAEESVRSAWWAAEWFAVGRELGTAEATKKAEAAAINAAAEAAGWASRSFKGAAEAEHESILDCLLAPRTQILFPANVKGLAENIYEKRDWVLMPILADALDDIGQHEMAAHCRQPIHAEGCHVLDSIIGKRHSDD